MLAAIMLFLAAGCTGGNGQNNGSEHGEGDVNVTDKPAEGNLIKVEPHEADIGIWYSVWYKYDPEYPNDSTKNLWRDWDIRYDPILPDGTYGLYDSGDKEIIMFHLKELTEAGIDFIIMDQTNHIDVGGGFINDRAIAVAATNPSATALPSVRSSGSPPAKRSRMRRSCSTTATCARSGAIRTIWSTANRC